MGGLVACRLAGLLAFQETEEEEKGLLQSQVPYYRLLLLPNGPMPDATTPPSAAWSSRLKLSSPLSPPFPTCTPPSPSKWLVELPGNEPDAGARGAPGLEDEIAIPCCK